jgi:hypothetical protein
LEKVTSSREEDFIIIIVVVVDRALYSLDHLG